MVLSVKSILIYPFVKKLTPSLGSYLITVEMCNTGSLD